MQNQSLAINALHNWVSLVSFTGTAVLYKMKAFNPFKVVYCRLVYMDGNLPVILQDGHLNGMLEMVGTCHTLS